MLASNVTDADLREAIAAFRQHIRAYQATLRQQGTWLMLATFGCWSVAHGPFQWIAYGLVLIVFVDRLRERAGDDRSFEKIAEALTLRIETSALEDDTKKARRWDLKDVQETELGPKVTIRRNSLFFLCWLFFGISFLSSTPLWKL